MQIQQIKTYSFDELPETIQTKTLDKYRDWLTNSWHQDGWAESIISDETEKLEKLGYKDIKIFFSGFGSQGDGACFEATVDIQKYLKAHKLGNKYRALYNHAECYGYSITQSGHYYHEHSMTVEEQYWSNDCGAKVEKQQDDLAKFIKEETVTLGKAIYKALEAEYDYYTEDSTLKENFLENDYQFTSDGEMFS